MRRTRLLGVALAATAMTVAGCSTSGAGNGGGAGNTGKGATIHILGAATTSIDYLKKLTPQFTKQTGIKVDITTVPYENLQQKMVLSLSSHAGEYDVVEPFTEMVPELQAGGWVLPLADAEKKYPSLSKIDLSDFLQSYEKFYSGQDGKPQFVAYEPDTRVLYYNGPLLKQKGFLAPQTWQQLEKAAAAYGGSKPPYGFMASTSQGPWVILTWLPVLYSTGQGVFDANGCPMLTTDKAVKATEFYVHMVKSYGPPAATSYTLFDIEPYMYKDQLAFADVDTAATPKHMQIQPFPAMNSQTTAYGSGEVGGWGYGIVKDSKNQAAAYKWIKWATSKNIMLKTELAGRQNPGRISLYSNAQLRAANPRLGGQLAALKNAKAYAPYPNEPQIESAIRDQLSAIVSGQQSVKSGLSKAQHDVLPLMKQIGKCKNG